MKSLASVREQRATADLKMSSFTCSNCGNGSALAESVDEVFNVDGRRVLVERIPALVCTRCGEPVFSAATAEHIRRLVHGEGHPIRTASLDVFAYS